MKYTYGLLVLLLIFCVSCEKPQNTFKDGGSLTYNGTSYALKSARLRHYLDNTTTENRLQLVLCSPTMSFANGNLSGYGDLLCITIATELSDLLPQTYEVSTGSIIASESYWLRISTDKTDTTKTDLSTGSLKFSNTDNGQKFDFTFFEDIPLQGFYEGTVTYNNDIDGVQVGTVVMGDSIIPLQKGDLMFWGPIFAEQLNYYEFYFYSCNLRHDDSGAINQGLMFVVGLHSEDATAPAEGTYPISRKNEHQTALYGHKSGNANWGTYWVHYRSASAQQKAFVMRDSVAFSRDGDSYKFTFQCTDQLDNLITGTYNGDFNLIDIR